MFETERLILRPLTENDVKEVFALRSDAEMMRYIREPQKYAESVNWIKLISSRWQTEKIGFGAVIEKNTKTFLGWCGLWRLQETGETEIGYAIAKKFQGQGFASEAAARYLQYGFDELKPDKIVAVARPENTASRRVMEKLGMIYEGIGRYYDRDLARYAIGESRWRKNSQQNSLPVGELY